MDCAHGTSCGSGHAFYEKLNELLEAESFNAFVEGLSAKSYAKKFSRPSLLPGIYFRSLLIGYFENIEANAESRGGERTHWDCGGFWALP